MIVTPINVFYSLRKRPAFRVATTGFPAKSLMNERRNSVFKMRRYYGRASDWSSCRRKFALTNQKNYPDLGGVMIG